MSPSRKPAKPDDDRRQARRDALSARLGRGSGRKPVNAPGADDAAGRPTSAEATTKPVAGRPASGKPDRGKAEGGARDKRPRQAGRRSRPGSERARAAGGGALTALRASAERAGPALREQILPAIARVIVGATLFSLRLLDRVVAAIAGVFGLLVELGRIGLSVSMGLLAWADRTVTPERAVVGVVVAAAVCLGVSQFTDYRGVQVGAPGYEGLEAVAGAPQAEVKEAGSAHSYLLLPLAVIAVVLAFAALLLRRWQLARLVALCGAIGVAVALAIDLPKGLDEGNAGVAYSGTEATLNDGFYAELAASGMLLVLGLILAMHLRRAKPEQAGARSRRRPSRRLPNSPSVAGGSP